MSVTGIVATFKIQAGKEAEFEATFRDLAAKVKANEKGCLLYDLFKSKKDPQTYIVMEQYASDADLAAHGNSEYFKAAFPKFGAVVAAAPVIDFFSKAD